MIRTWCRRRVLIGLVCCWGYLTASAWCADAKALPEARLASWALGSQHLVPADQAVPSLERDALVRLLQQHKVMFIDVREPEAFAKSHLPNSRNIPFDQRDRAPSTWHPPSGAILIPYCNWDFRAYVAAMEWKRQGWEHVAMMFPHGLRGWIAAGLPVAGTEYDQTDRDAWTTLEKKLQDLPAPPLPSPSAQSSNRTVSMTLHILPRRVEPRHLEASVGDRIVLELVAEEEDHWFVIPDFGVEMRMAPGERRTVEFTITRAGYFPFGCISCCTRYRCQTKQAIVVNVTAPLSTYGE